MMIIWALGKLIKLAIAKYGIENFKKEYLAIFDNLEDMFNMESELVNEDFLSGNVYNLKLGGFGGWEFVPRSKDTQQKAIAGLRDTLYSKYGVFNASQLNHVRQSQSSYMKDRHANGEIQLPPSFAGKTHNEETKSKIGSKNAIYQNGLNNSQFGTMWIHNIELKQNKKISKNDPIPNGWIIGRKMKF